MKLSLITLLFCVSTLSQAKLVDLAKNYKWTSHSQAVASMKRANKRGLTRKISNIQELDDSYLSKPFKSFRDHFLKIKTPLEIEVQIRELNKKYDTLPTDLKLLTALLTPLLKMKSFAYKMYPLLTASSMTHSIMVSRVYRVASFLSINLPTEQWDAGFRYTTEPFDAAVQNERFSDIEGLQKFVEVSIYPALEKAAQRIQALDLSSQQITWDNKLLYGTASFQDEVKRYRIIGDPERLVLLSSIHNSMAWVLRFSAYNLEKSMSLIKDISRDYGFDKILGIIGRVDGVSAYKLVKTIKKKKYSHLFTLRGKDGAENMKYAYKHIQEATRLAVIAWEELKHRRNQGRNEFVLIQSDAFAPFIQQIDRNSKAILATVNGKSVLRSDVTGEVVTVDFRSFFQTPPQDLKELLPVFPKKYTVPKNLSKMIDGKKVSYRNYHYGAAKVWNVEPFKGILPELENKQDVAKYTRIINQSVGSAPVATILNSVMFYNL